MTKKSSHNYNEHNKVFAVFLMIFMLKGTSVSKVNGSAFFFMQMRSLAEILVTQIRILYHEKNHL